VQYRYSWRGSAVPGTAATDIWWCMLGHL